MFSIYTIAFNVVKNQFDFKEAVENFCFFAEEVVVAVNKSEDGTLEQFLKLQSTYDNLKIVEANVSYEDPELDGKLFNIALGHTTNPYKIILGLDHRISLRQKDKWIQLASHLDKTDAFMIPCLELYGDIKKCKYESAGLMWFLHKEGLKRGVVNFAKRQDGTFDPSKSDSNELIYHDGSLVSSLVVSPLSGYSKNAEDFFQFLSAVDIYVYHIGYLDLNKRILVNNSIWKDIWENKRGVNNTVPNTIQELNKVKTYHHNLKLWNEK